MKTKRFSWKLLLLCAIPFVPLLAATSFRDGVYRIANRAIPSWQLQANNELLAAIEKNDLICVKLLVSRGADVNYQKSRGETPLIYALLRGIGSPHVEVATYLVEQGADPNATTASDKTVFFQFAENYFQNERVPQFTPSVQLLRVMLNAGIKPNATYKNVDILYQSVQLQSIRHVRELLQNGANPNAPLRTRGMGTTTLLLAAVHVLNPELVEILLNHQADPNLIGSVYDNGITDLPLVQVLSYRNFSKPLSPREFKIVALLLRAGADANARASSDMSENLIDALLLHADINKNARATSNSSVNMIPIYNGWPPLHYAVFANDIQTTKLLLRYGAKPKLRDKDGKTALDYARREKRIDVVRILE